MKLIDLPVDEKAVLISQIMFDQVRIVHDFSLPSRSRLNCAFVGYYAACSGNSLRSIETIYRPLETGSIVCPEMPVRNYHYTSRNSPERRSPVFVFVCVCDFYSHRSLFRLVSDTWQSADGLDVFIFILQETSH